MQASSPTARTTVACWHRCRAAGDVRQSRRGGGAFSNSPLSLLAVRFMRSTDSQGWRLD